MIKEINELMEETYNLASYHLNCADNAETCLDSAYNIMVDRDSILQCTNAMDL